MPAQRRGELTYARIDREWPHQVALPDDICTEQNYSLIRAFCEAHRLHHQTRQVQAIWPDRKYQNYRLHCFADSAQADLFQSHFGGEFFDPKRDRENGRAQGAWYRNGVWTRLLESGPLKVPAMLRD
jgi:hypothetical protein